MLSFFFYWISITVYVRELHWEKKRRRRKRINKRRKKKKTFTQIQQKSLNDRIAWNRQTREEHACNEHFRVLNFLYLSFSIRPCVYGLYIWRASPHSSSLQLPFVVVVHFVNLLLFPSMKLLLIDLSNFSLFAKNIK